MIATGSDNTNRYFRTRYDGIPALFRGSRISTAVLTGRETPEELSGLWDDMFRYFGLGCRNVSRLFVPQNYDVGQLAAALSRRPLTLAKYVHGYRQARALNLLLGTAFTDGGFFMLRETGEQGHTLGEISYTRYSDFAEVSRWLEDNDEKVQCVVTSALLHSRRAEFGDAQHPRPEDYPDGADVIDFLHRI